MQLKKKTSDVLWWKWVCGLSVTFGILLFITYSLYLRGESTFHVELLRPSPQRSIYIFEKYKDVESNKGQSSKHRTTSNQHKDLQSHGGTAQLTTLQPKYNSTPAETTQVTTEESAPYKEILFWTDKLPSYTHQLEINKNGCPTFKCKFSNILGGGVNNPKLSLQVSFYDAIVFSDLYAKINKDQFISRYGRNMKTRYILLQRGPSAGHGVIEPKFNGFFNWSASHRLDTDIDISFGKFVDIKTGQRLDPAKTGYDEKLFKETLSQRDPNFLSLADRPNKALWLVSHCSTSSNRERYGNELKKHFQINIIGDCTKNKCRGNKILCSPEALRTQHKYYIAFENRLCQDYVSEKFFKNAITNNLIPIVLYGANYKRVAPPHSYIDAAKFETPKDLAEYLLYLDKNPAEYLSYFWWKDEYQTKPISILCNLCAKLWTPQQPATSIVPNPSEWWNKNGEFCRNYKYPWNIYNETF